MRQTPRRTRKGLRLALAASLALAAIAGAERVASAADEPRLSLEGAVGWINSDGPIHLEKLRGKIVLLDFWTYCCINCHHVLPDLARLEKKYKNQLVVIGVHTAKFDAEKDTENIREKVREYNIKHPVANDANQVIMDRFGALRYNNLQPGRMGWPTLVVIDSSGELVRPYFSGEGHGAELDKLIGDLVARHKARGELDETPIEFPAENDKPHESGLLYPGKVTADANSKRLYISDTGHNRIVVTDLSGQFVEAIGNGKSGLVDGDFQSATFDRPQGTCLLEGILYVADTENHALRAVDLKGKTVRTVAGNGEQNHSFSGSGKGPSTGLNSPWDVIPIPGTRTLAIAMAGPHQLWRYDLARGTVGQWAGSGYENILDGPLGSARFAQPSGLATDGQQLFVADSEVSAVRTVSIGSPHRVGTIVGTGLFQFGDEDGKGDSVRLQHCLGLAFGDGKLFIADTYNNKIKVCEPRTRTVRTFVGSHNRGSADDPPRFNEPGGLSLAGSTLYVADTNNHSIRAVDVDSKAVKTLDLDSVKAPSRDRAYKFPNPTVINVAPVQAMPGKMLTFDVALALPPGYKLSTEAPLVYLAEADRPDVFGPEVSPTGQRVDHPAKQFLLRLPMVRQALTGSTLQVKVSLSAFVCLPNTLCTVKNFVWNVPITFAPGSPSQVRLTTAAQ
jgi:thiol-disulfide isomerase/thioredoxin